MGEFKSGTLKSGGSGKKVTNPKQAIAIALSEANSMNQGGMMQNPVMQRPMFQTPMQRQGLGIMAGVAPVQGFERGGGVRATERNLENNDELSFMDYLRATPEVIGEMVVGEDDTMSDFFSFEKTPEGQGLNLRDLTDFFIVDPDDPTDVAIGTATAGLMATGVGAPGAIAARLGRMGFKGKKVADKVERAIRLGVGDTRGKTFGRGQTARLLASAPDVFAGEEEEMPAPGGIGSLMVEEPSQPDKNYNVGVSKGGVPFKESFAYHRAKGDDVFTWNGELYTTDLEKEPTGMNKGGLVGLMSRLKDKTIAKLKGKKDKEQADDVVDVVDDVKVVDDAPEMPSPSRTARILKGLGAATGIGVGGVLGASALMGDDEKEAEEEAATQVVVPKEPEQNVEVNEEGKKVLPKVRPFGGKIARALFGEDEAIGGEKQKDRGFVGILMDRLSDPRVQYQLAKAGQASEGYVPRNFGSDVTLAGAEYDQLQAKLDAAKPELVQQYEAIRPYAEQGPDETEEDVDRKVFKSLFDRMDAATQLEALLTLYKSVPNAAANLGTFEEFTSNLGLDSVSRLLTRTADTQ